MPYVDQKSNILASVGQSIIVLSFVSALLMHVDLTEESFDINAIGGIMLLANVPMSLVLIFDTVFTFKDQVHSSAMGILAAEMGGKGATYRYPSPSTQITVALRT